MGYQDEFRREFLKDEPRGGFVTDVACPYCGQAVAGNIPSTPERRTVGFVRNYEVGVHSTNKCTNRRCGETFFVHRYSDGSWVVRQSSDGARQV
jgi:hypothetical protein